MDREAYARAFVDVERDFEKGVEAFGVPFEPIESEPRSQRAQAAAACGCRCENGGASLVSGWLSPACKACRTGERTATFFVDLNCTKHCYFCFNPNQENYDYFLSHKRDIAAELRQAHAEGRAFDCLAVTGGEPLLHVDAVLGFLAIARELYPHAHIRLYTAGDLLDAATAQALADAGLDEIRFSIKPTDVDGEQGRERTFRAMELAVGVIPSVMIEVPVIPGTLSEMKDLLVRADELGVRGVNLLEFCFPLCNADEFRKRGFKLRKHPYAYLYDYWYGGGIPVAGSESEALELLAFAHERGLALGVQYCSSDNKNTGQVYQQNLAYDYVGSLRRAFPWMSHDEDDRFLKCAKAFGSDAESVRGWLEERGVPFGTDNDIPCVSFPMSVLPRAKDALPDARFGVSVNVAEQRAGAWTLREVALDPASGK